MVYEECVVGAWLITFRVISLFAIISIRVQTMPSVHLIYVRMCVHVMQRHHTTFDLIMGPYVMFNLNV